MVNTIEPRNAVALLKDALSDYKLRLMGHLNRSKLDNVVKTKDFNSWFSENAKHIFDHLNIIYPVNPQETETSYSFIHTDINSNTLHNPEYGIYIFLQFDQRLDSFIKEGLFPICNSELPKNIIHIEKIERETPTSTLLSILLKNFQLRINFLTHYAKTIRSIRMENFPHDQYHAILFLGEQTASFQNIMGIYLKYLVALELEACLDSGQSSKDQLDKFATQLRKGQTKDILYKNCQSTTEFAFKLLSVIAILAGVGLITTGYLMARRYEKTGGKSINFFQPIEAFYEQEIIKLVPSAFP